MSQERREPNEALRGEIRLAGHKSRLVGWVIACSCLLASIIGVVAITLPTSGYQLLSALAAGICLTAVISGFGLIFARVARRGFADRRSHEFRQILKELPPDRQAAVLLPLRDDPSSDVREIVRPLIEQLQVAREVTPADA